MNSWGQNNDALEAAAAEKDEVTALVDAAKEAEMDPIARAEQVAEAVAFVQQHMSAEGRTRLCATILINDMHVLSVDLGEEHIVNLQCPPSFVMQLVREMLVQLEVTEDDIERIRKIVMEEEDVGIN